MSKTTIDTIIKQLELLPHPEGGFYKEVYRSKGLIPKGTLSTFDGDRNYCTSIYFLLTAENFSAFHRIKQDEVWHFYGGDPLTIHVIDKNGTYTENTISNDLTKDLEPQFVVPADCWFASSVKNGGTHSLVGCTVAPGFDFNDFELANRQELIQSFPNHETIISLLTR